MNIATILFTYNRPFHTRKVLEGLKGNTILPEKLFVFHDGKKESTDIIKWNEVEYAIREINWCETEIITSDVNKGLADSISSGVTLVLEKYDAVIVLEDDCVPHPQFMEYMIMALKKYANNGEVYSIGASAEPVDVPFNGFDAYFVGRINSWGWGTWKDRWNVFERDYRILGRIKKDSELSEWLNVWGQDLEGILIDNIYGKADSWAAFWALNVIEHKGLNLSPYKSYVDNIGFDGSGVHCKKIDVDMKTKPKNKMTDIKLPDVCSIVDNYKHVFLEYFPWTNPLIREEYNRKVAYKLLDTLYDNNVILDWCMKNNIKNVCIWGVGAICTEILRRISDKLDVIGIVLSHPSTDYYGGIKVYAPFEIPRKVDAVIVIPGYDIDRITKTIFHELKDKLVTIDKLLE